ncbi:camk family protein kinase [Stylonychia lemnae]|uniref:Camk family protein kinase n=1 Tax=Stylonychia lemnae TaxID=5949 RepID=A0A078AAT4_STYLE|nr:camk family protein kinase [Stylonychia lemnae]|eukprot:CDW78956.1 camk family protein kinase [Stylonychia lemnae]
MAATGLGVEFRDTEEQYRIKYQLSQDPFGKTYQADKLVDHKIINGGRRVALEISKIYRGMNKKDNEEFAREILRIMTVNASHQLRHPNIVEIEDVLLNDQAELFIVSELGECNLKDFINRKINGGNQSFNNSEIAFIMLQLLEGLEYIHDSSFIHRDISPDNLFVFNDGIIKIGSFDISDFGKQDYINAGKDCYKAPEIILGQQYDNKVDIWSLGIVFYYLMTGTYQIKKEAEMKDVNSDRQQYNKYQCYVMNYYFNQVKSSVGNSMQQLKNNAGVLAKDLKDENNKNVAFKKQDLSILNFRKGENLSYEVLRILREIETFQLKHPNIVEILDSYLTIDCKLIIVSELAKYDLTEFKNQRGEMNYSDISTIMIQLLEGLEEAHCKGFIHRDINPQKILVFDNDIVKICDFDIESFGILSVAQAGAGHYMAPEVLNLESYDKSVDIWSLGVLLYYLCHGTERQNMKPINAQLIKNIKITFLPQYSKFQEIFDEMTTFQPNQRPKITYLKQKFMKFIDNSTYYQNYQNELIMFKLNLLKNSINKDFEQLYNLLQPHFNNNKLAYDNTIKLGLEDFKITIKNFQNLVIYFQQRF